MIKFVAENYVDRLLEIEENWSEEAHEILEKLVEIGEPAIQPLIEKYLGHPEIYYPEDYSFEVCEALGEIGEKAVAALISALAGTNSHLQSNAARALGQIGDEQAIKPLEKAIHETRSYSAIYALGDIGGDNAAQMLLQLLHNGNFEKQDIIGWLGRTRSDNVFPTLMDALSDNDPEVRWYAVQSLRDLKQQRIVEALVSVLDDPDDRVAYAAATILARDYHDARSADTLARNLNSKVAGIRASAVKSLGRIRSDQYVSNIRKLMERDEDIGVCLNAACALAELGLTEMEDAEKLITYSLSSKDVHTRFTAICALRGSSSESALKWLVPRLYDTNPFIRYYTILLLGEFASMKALDALKEMMKRESHGLVRKEVFKAIQKLENNQR